jgi:hypothetical protein
MRQAACISQHGCGGLLQQPMLPALTFQITSLTSLSGLSTSSGGLPCRHPAAAAAANGTGGAGLLLPGHYQQQPQQQLLVHQQQRPIFNFAGFGDDLKKSHHEKKLLG